MKNNLKSLSWPLTAEKMRLAHLQALDMETINVNLYKDAFDSLIESVRDERTLNDAFACDVSFLTTDTGFIYDLKDVLEEYFDVLEANEQWTLVETSAKTLLNTFVWKKTKPSEYLYRIGNALLKQNKLEEAEEFGLKWLKDYPNDLYAAASMAFLYMEMNREKEALEITKKFLSEDLVCNDDTMTIFMAAERLYEITNDANAKQRISEKIREYNELISK